MESNVLHRIALITLILAAFSGANAFEFQEVVSDHSRVSPLLWSPDRQATLAVTVRERKFKPYLTMNAIASQTSALSDEQRMDIPEYLIAELQRRLAAGDRDGVRALFAAGGEGDDEAFNERFEEFASVSHDRSRCTVTVLQTIQIGEEVLVYHALDFGRGEGFIWMESLRRFDTGYRLTFDFYKTPLEPLRLLLAAAGEAADLAKQRPMDLTGMRSTRAALLAGRLEPTDKGSIEMHVRSEALPEGIPLSLYAGPDERIRFLAHVLAIYRTADPFLIAALWQLAKGEERPADLLGWSTMSALVNPDTGEQVREAEGYLFAFVETWEGWIAVVSPTPSITNAQLIFVREKGRSRHLTLGFRGTSHQQIERLLMGDFGLPGVLLVD